MVRKYVGRARTAPLNDRGVETAEIVIGLKEARFLSMARWFPAPDAGMNSSRPRWGSTTQTITGGYVQLGSPFGGKVLSMSWSMLNPEHVGFLEDLTTRALAVEGSQILAQFPYHENCASPFLGRPAHLSSTYCPAVWTTQGQRVAVPTPAGGLSFKAETLDTPDYDEYFIVPPGYTLTAKSSTATGNRAELWQQAGPNSFQYSRLTDNGTFGMRNSSQDFRVAFLRIGSGRAEGEVGPLAAQLHRTGTAPTVTTEMPAQGSARLAVVPDSLTVQEHSGPLGWLSASIEFQEVLPWV